MNTMNGCSDGCVCVCVCMYVCTRATERGFIHSVMITIRFLDCPGYVFSHVNITTPKVWQKALTVHANSAPGVMKELRSSDTDKNA